ncbi:MAG: potassium/proton antiporter [Actinobacteria bacterium]|nr:potassium/proton antiporter [Actinomycetota bacterium]
MADHAPALVLALTEIGDFGAIVLAVSATVFVGLLGMRLADRFSVPYAALFLIGAAVVSDLWTELQTVLSVQDVERIAVVALLVILFDGGLHIGLGRFRRSLGPILGLGVVGTFLTAAVIACAAHYVLGFTWIESGLIGAAVAPTDPAVTFSVFGAREVRGRSGTILEGEAGVNDPVGIALMIGMIELASEDDGSLVVVAEEFAIEMVLGLVVGIAGALLLLPVFRRVQVTGLALYPIRVLAGAGIVYGLAAVIGGSGFLAVFVAGIVLGDAAMPRKGEIESFHSSIAGLAEIAVFVALGLTITVGDLDSVEIWAKGLGIAVILAFVARPLAVFPLLLPARLTNAERVFISWGGLKGAVPILLGALAVLAGVDGASELYGIVFIVVVFSVVVQGVSLTFVARKLRIPFRRVDHDLAEVLEFVVGETAFASGARIRELPLGERAWVGVLIRDGRPQRIDGNVVLSPGDRVHVYAQAEDAAAIERIFVGTPA